MDALTFCNRAVCGRAPVAVAPFDQSGGPFDWESLTLPFAQCAGPPSILHLSITPVWPLSDF